MVWQPNPGIGQWNTLVVLSGAFDTRLSFTNSIEYVWAGPSMECPRLPRRVLQLRSLTGTLTSHTSLKLCLLRDDSSQLCRYAHTGSYTGQSLTLGLTLLRNRTQGNSHRP